MSFNSISDSKAVTATMRLGKKLLWCGVADITAGLQHHLLQRFGSVLFPDDNKRAFHHSLQQPTSLAANSLTACGKVSLMYRVLHSAELM